MESYNISKNAIETTDFGSTEEFRLFITNLFEKNGVLNDLRAYLRGHIFKYLQSVENGGIQKSREHFTQRLQFKFQAINAVIAEYLMKLKFNYSCPVFISEIPLANMVFDFTNNLFQNSLENNNLKFSAKDIFQILNYLGIQCDQEHIMEMLEDYQKHDEPLLMCILKHVFLYQNLAYNINEDSLSIDSHNKKNNEHLKCKHYTYCKLCQNHLSHIKEKYKKRKKYMAENLVKSTLNNSNIKNMGKDMKVIEKKLIGEMFEQLKNVYEGEIELLREGDAKKVKHSLANHASLMQKHRSELEKEMESRRMVMESEFRERKEFVAGLAATLKVAHEKLRDARHKLKRDADDLTSRENSMKSQLRELEETLKAKGEDMQKQISRELELLDEQHQNLKKEKIAIDYERAELENLKKFNETNFKLVTSFNIQERDNLLRQKDAMKSELDVLQKYILLSNESKLTQNTTVKPYNNEVIHDNERAKMKHVVNDLKNLKNVNYSQTVSVMTKDHKWCQDVTGLSKCDGTCLETLERLREEHKKLQEFSKQQSSHIELLSLSLRQINQAASTCASTHAISKEKNSDNIMTTDHKSLESTVIDVKDVGKTSERTENIEGQDSQLKYNNPQTTRDNRDLLRKRKEWTEGDKSSNKTVREAKLRLRKLQLEAEAVERSYLMFRQRRAQERWLLLKKENNLGTLEIGAKDKVEKNLPKEYQRNPYVDEIENCSYDKIYQQCNLDFDKYLRTYHTDVKSSVPYQKYIKDINIKYSKKEKENELKNEKKNENENGYWHSFNYLETPLMEFRKLYQASSRSTTRRPKKKRVPEKQCNKHSYNIPNKTLDQRSPNTSIPKISEKAQDMNMLDEYLDDKNPNTTSETNVGDILTKDVSEGTSYVQVTKTTNVRKEFESEYINNVREELNDEKCDKIVDTTEPHKNNSIIEKAEDVQNIITNEDSSKINDVSKDNMDGQTVDLESDNLNEVHRNNGLNVNTIDINKIKIKETSEDINIEKNYYSSVSTSKNLSDHKTRDSDIEISRKSLEYTQMQAVSTVTENKDNKNRLTEIETHVANAPGQMPHDNDTTKNEILNKSLSLENNVNAEEPYEEKPKDIEKRTGSEYEDDFSVSVNEDSLSRNNSNSPISILKSSEEENFWN